ncbi:polyribonucleotide nucleotidyltransferase, partial [Patescibacteria group bacterium]|nr:polyribonucleotide nucleotidyltransferase [Patescibacteria group bacterium]
MVQHQIEINLGDKLIKLQTGLLAPQANATVLATLGKTVVMATVVMGQADDTKDYFPLSVEFMDKLYAGGIIKSSRWLKREGGLVDESILVGRLIDRAIRPLFPAGLTNEVQLLVTVLSNDKTQDLVIPSFLAASAALSISDIPFNGPVSAVRIAQIDGKLVANPTLTQLNQSNLDLLLCTAPSGVNMIEAGANIVDNDTFLKAITLAKSVGDKINKQLLDFVKTCAKKKVEFTSALPSDELVKEVDALIKKDIENFLENGADDGKHMISEDLIVKKALDHYQDKIEKEEVTVSAVVQAVQALVKKNLRSRTLAGLRFDGRKADELRPLSAQVGVLPCTHGSAFFQRGLTQALTITTLSSLRDQQTIQDSFGDSDKRYIHYYSGQPFSTGQTGRIGRPGRREVGHGALAEKALLAVIPSVEDFPYTIVLNSEVLSQNGSSSMASTCGSTLSLLDAGVPLKDKV